MINEANIAQIKASIDGTNEILVLTSQNANADRLAASLALYLGLQKLGKKVQIATEANLTVGQSPLFGIGEIGNRFPQLKGGDMTLALENVVIDQGPDAGKVPALEKLDWFPEGKDLKLVFHVLPGQRFEPSNVKVTYAQGGFGLVIVIGASSLEGLGRIYGANKSIFEQTAVVNIDNQAQNNQFGVVNVVDPAAGSVSEMMVGVLNQLGVRIDGDMASNILIGIYNGTRNLTQKAGAETFLAVGQAMQAGGKLPVNTSLPQTADRSRPEGNAGLQPQGQQQFRPNNPQSGQDRRQSGNFQASGSSRYIGITTDGSGNFRSNQNPNNNRPQQQQQQQQQRSANGLPLTADGQNVQQNPQPVNEVSAQPVQPSVGPAQKRENPFLTANPGAFNPVFSPQFGENTIAEVQPEPQQAEAGFDLKGFNESQQVSADSLPASPELQRGEPQTADSQTNTVNSSQPVQQQAAEAEPVVVSDEEEINGEGEFSPAPDWLTPKVYKGGGGLG